MDSNSLLVLRQQKCYFRREMVRSAITDRQLCVGTELLHLYKTSYLFCPLSKSCVSYVTWLSWSELPSGKESCHSRRNRSHKSNLLSSHFTKRSYSRLWSFWKNCQHVKCLHYFILFYYFHNTWDRKANSFLSYREDSFWKKTYVRKDDAVLYLFGEPRD